MKKKFLLAILFASTFSIKAQNIELGQMVRSLYCADVSCIDSILVGYGYKKTAPRKESDGVYTLYTDQKWNKAAFPGGPNVVNYVKTNKGEIIIILITFEEALATNAKSDLTLPSLKFDYVSTSKPDELGVMHTYNSEKHPKILAFYKLEVSLDVPYSRYTISVLKQK